MNFNIDFGKWVADMLEKYEKSPAVRRLMNFLAFVLFMYVIGTLIGAVASFMMAIKG